MWALIRCLVGLGAIIAVLALTVIFWLAQHVPAADGFRGVSMFLEFAPRWIGLLPVVPGLLACWPSRRRIGALLVVTGLYCVLALGYAVPMGSKSADGAALLVGTYNVGGGSVPPGEVLAWYVAEGLDVLFLQEADQNGFSPAIRQFGLNTHCHGKVCVATQHELRPGPLLSRDRIEGWGTYAATYELCRGTLCIPVMNVHLETPRKAFEVLGDKRVGLGRLDYLAERRDTESAVASLAITGPRAVIAGDFNMTVHGSIYHQYWGHWQNAFSEAGSGFGYTKSGRRLGARIDHILHGSAWRTVSATVQPTMGGDHRPVIAELRLAMEG
jgi:vancomycin resistance protein VanJ